MWGNVCPASLSSCPHVAGKCLFISNVQRLFPVSRWGFAGGCSGRSWQGQAESPSRYKRLMHRNRGFFCTCCSLFSSWVLNSLGLWQGGEAKSSSPPWTPPRTSGWDFSSLNQTLTLFTLQRARDEVQASKFPVFMIFVFLLIIISSLSPSRSGLVHSLKKSTFNLVGFHFMRSQNRMFPFKLWKLPLN